MTLEAGTQLGTYSIVGPLGAGGMGEVYRATDTTLDREVAVKVLPDVMAHDPERVARFEREAKLLASLSHPQIGAIYGFEQAGVKRFLVLELIEGPTLAERIATGPLMVEESLDIARQMAEALEAAHEKGIIHRDLKPANVKITPVGQVKVLDFGLAKALAEEEPDTETSPGTSSTITQHYTKPGVILGTAAYMSPEQARGRPVDKRSDIWSFGCVLYECLTGDSLFQGETVTDSIGAILHKQPDWERLPTETPPTIQLLLRRCLTKDRKRRLHHIADARVEIEAAIADPTSSALGLASSALASEGKTSIWSLHGIAAIASGMILTAAVALGIGWSLWPEPTPPPLVETPPPLPVEHFSYVLSQRESDLRAREYPRTLMFSAHGSHLAYLVRNQIDGYDLFLRSWKQTLPVKLTHMAYHPMFPTFSPDGQSLVVHAFGEALHKIYTDGRPPFRLCETDKIIGPITGLTWTTDGHIIFGQMSRANLLLRVSENGGAVEEINLPSTETVYPFHVHALPGGQAILYTASENFAYRGGGSIRVYSFRTKETKTLVENGDSPVYSASGHLLFMRESTLFAAPFNAQTLELGPVAPVMQGVDSNGFWFTGVFSLTKEGTLYFHPEDERATDKAQIFKYDLEGKQQAEVFSSQKGLFNRLEISPAGDLVALEMRDANMGSKPIIGMLETNLDILRKLPREVGNQSDPIFSPDGEWIYYAARDEGGKWRGVYRRRIDGGGEEELVDEGPRECRPFSISPDGKHMWVSEFPTEELSPGTWWDIAVIPLSENGESTLRKPWFAAPDAQVQPAVSPNGRWVAYLRYQDEAPNIYVKSFSGEGAEVQVSRDNGREPFWSPQGDALYFIANFDSTVVMMAPVITGAEPEPVSPPTNFKTDVAKVVLDLKDGTRDTALMPDGKSLLVIADAVPADGKEIKSTDDLAVIRIERNFFTDLEIVAPTKKESSP